MATATEVYRYHPTNEEIAEVLSKRVTAALGTLNEDGSIHLTYVLFLHEDGRVFVETSSVTRKSRNILERPSASFLVQAKASSGRTLMVAGEGAARVVGGADAEAINRRIRAKYLVPDALEAIARAWSKLDDVTLELTRETWRSWTGALLHHEAVQELGPEIPYEEAWLPED